MFLLKIIYKNKVLSNEVNVSNIAPMIFILE